MTAAEVGDALGIARVARVAAATAVATIAAHEGTLSALPEEVCP